MKSINELIDSKKVTAQNNAKSDDVRFMIVITEAQREDLRALADTLGQKQIKFASELFGVALEQAKSAVAAASKKPAEPAAK